MESWQPVLISGFFAGHRVKDCKPPLSPHHLCPKSNVCEGATATEIPDVHLDLLLERKAVAHLATVMPDGSPQNTPVQGIN